MSRLLGNVLVIFAVSANAATAQVISEPADSVQIKLRGALRALASAQEKHYTAHGTYSDDVETLKTYPGCEIAAGVTVAIQHASPLGWAAESTHNALPGESCVYWIARPNTIGPLVTRRQKYPGHEFPGRAICDFDPLPSVR
jgi:type II secretory pathway pseudopilin PulG